jgi:DNA-binding CsgD family transcriptional regulator
VPTVAGNAARSKVLTRKTDDFRSDRTHTGGLSQEVFRVIAMKASTRPSFVLSDFVGLVYQAALDDVPQPDLVVALRQLLSAGCVQMLEFELPGWVPSGTTTSVEPGRFAAFESDYARHGFASDPLVRGMLGGSEGEVHTWDADAPDSEHDDFRQLLAGHGLRRAVGGFFRCGPRATVVLARARVQDLRFDLHALERLRAVLPHLRRAALLRQEARRERAAACAATRLLQQLPIAYALADGMGRCIECSEAFRQSAQRAGIQFVVGRMRFATGEQQAVWERALHELLLTGTERTLHPVGGLAGPSILLKPWAGDSAAGPDEERLALVVLEEHPVAAGAPPDMVRTSQARLTKAEMEVLGSMLSGVPAKMIAAQRGASVHTVRSQIVAVLEKTGYRTQRELVASVHGNSGFLDSGYVDSAFRDSGLDSGLQFTNSRRNARF